MPPRRGRPRDRADQMRRVSTGTTGARRVHTPAVNHHVAPPNTASVGGHKWWSSMARALGATVLAALTLAACSPAPTGMQAAPILKSSAPSSSAPPASSMATSPRPETSVSAKEGGRRAAESPAQPKAKKPAPDPNAYIPMRAFPWGNLPEDEFLALAKDYEIFNAGPAGTPFGWGLCATPITFSIDARTLPAKYRDAASADVSWALGWWGTVTGLAFSLVPDVPTSVDRETSVITPDDGVERERHIYIRFTPDEDVASLAGNVVGLGGPTRLYMKSRELVGGALNLSTAYSKTASVAERRALMLHELGHVIGLGHSKDPRNIMYPIVSENNWLGPGDMIGAAILDRPCTSGDPDARQKDTLEQLYPLDLPYNEFNR